MARQDLSIQFEPADERRLIRFMNDVADGVSSMDPFFDAVEMHMIDSITTNFEVEGRPQKWEPLSPVTVEMKGSDAILQDQGDLKRSVNAQNSERGKLSLKLWAGDEKASFHQDVDMDPLDQFGVTNERGMPFRPFIMFQDEDIDEIENILDKYMKSLGV